MAKRKATVPVGYEKYFTDNRGEDFNQTIEDIETIAKRALAYKEVAEGDRGARVRLKHALTAIYLLCVKTGTDPVE